MFVGVDEVVFVGVIVVVTVEVIVLVGVIVGVLVVLGVKLGVAVGQTPHELQISDIILDVCTSYGRSKTISPITQHCELKLIPSPNTILVFDGIETIIEVP